MDCLRVHATAVPPDALIARYLPADHADAFLCAPLPVPALSPDRFLAAFWASIPTWAACLMRLRDILVIPFGLQPGSGLALEEIRGVLEDDTPEAGRGRPGDPQGPAPATGAAAFVSLAARSEHETVLCLDDAHLTAWISALVEMDRQRLILSTVVRYNRPLGRLYFMMVRPAHDLIVPGMIRAAFRALGKPVH